MQANCLIVLTKHPAPGLAKTRLAATLGADAAAQIAAAFLNDTAALVFGLPGITPLFSYAPPSARGEFEHLIGARAALLHEQPSGDFGGRLRASFAAAFDRGAERVAVIATDSPSLPCFYIQTAFAALCSCDVVVGPALDGGYYLLGLTALQPALVDGIAWSTHRVLRQTLARVERLGLDVQLLPPWYDVDEEADLIRLRRDVAAQPGALHHTRRALLDVASRTPALPRCDDATLEGHYAFQR